MSISFRLLHTRNRPAWLGSYLVDVANARRTAEETDALIVIRLSSPLDVHEHVVRDSLDVGGPQECATFGRYTIAYILAGQVMALDCVVGASHEVGHARAGSAA